MTTPSKLVKSISFDYEPRPEVFRLLEWFREMVNEAIRIGIEKDARSRNNLGHHAYRYLRSKYPLHYGYIQGAIDAAASIVKKYRKWQRRPYAKRLMLRMDDSRSYAVNYLLLRLPTTPGNYVFVTLRGGEYQLSALRDSRLKRGAIIITPSKIAITFSKQAEPMKTEGKVAYDINLSNVTGVSTSSDQPQVYDTSDIVRIRELYARTKSHVRRRDYRIRREIFRKYGRKEKNRVHSRLHLISKKIIESATRSRHSIVLEGVKYLRRRHRRGSKDYTAMRRMLNAWPYAKLQHLIEHKARWAGVPVEYVSPSYTSRRCSRCGSLNRELGYEKTWQCPDCGAMHDRDVNAARNLLQRSFKDVQAMGLVVGGLASEAMVQEHGTAINPESRCQSAASDSAKRFGSGRVDSVVLNKGDPPRRV